MAIARMKLQDIKSPVIDRAKMRATTDADIRRHAIEDGQDPLAAIRADDWWPSTLAVRQSLGMTQEEFAKFLRIAVATVRNWEQKRVKPDPAARTLLRVVAMEPDAVKRAMAVASLNESTADQPVHD